MRVTAACDDCGKGKVGTVVEPFSACFREGTYLIEDAEYQKCDSCGRAFFTKQQMDSLQKKAAAAARRAQGLLTPQEIKGFRSLYGLSQAALEAILGVSPKSVIRWEKGTVFQNPAVDKFIRVLMDNPELVEQLRPPRRGERAVPKPTRKTPPAVEQRKILTSAPVGCSELALAA